MTKDNKGKALIEIRKRREKLERLESLLQALDDEDIDFLRSTLLAEDDEKSDQSPQVQNPITETGSSNYGKLEAAVRIVITGMDAITVPDIIQRLEDDGFQFSAKSPLAAVNQTVRRLRGNGELIEIEASSGRRPAKYRRSPTYKEQSQERLSLVS